MLRRKFFVHLTALTGGILLFPRLTRYAVAQSKPQDKLSALLQVPLAKPTDWDPVGFNRLRGNAGAVPLLYLEDINSPDSEKKYIGQHLPYVPKTNPSQVSKGFIALMWGDPSKSHVRHPAAPPDPSTQFKGHWFDWIRIRKSTSANSPEVESRYTGWPQANPGDSGAFAVLGGGDITADEGHNTIYLAALPKDVKPGDTIRIWGHCLQHGEYVDFLTL